MASIDWELAAIVEVPQSDRIQCQCKECGRIVYKRVHIIVWGDQRIECWGENCYERELGAAKKAAVLSLGGQSCRRLTDEERGWLLSNRERLIERFREELQEQKKRAEILAAVVSPWPSLTSSTPTPVPPRAPPSSAVPPTRPPPLPLDRINPEPLPEEPMHDPRYREIRARVVDQFATDEDGEFRREPDKMYWRRTIAENALQKFRPARRVR